MQPSSAKAPMASHKARVQPMCADTHQLGVARCFALVRTDLFYKHVPRYRRVANVAQANLASAAAKAYYGPLGPAQLIQAYNLPSAKAGSGQTVGIVDAGDDPTAESDLAQYRKAFNIAACTTANGCFSKLNQNGKTSPLPAANPGWAGEISLDLDMVSAICPNCKIVLIEAKTASFKDLGTSVGTAAKAGAHQISNSYGGPECIVNKKGKIQCGSPLPAAKYYSIKNTIITASSGDSSWFAGPQAPADFQTVVSVGGTSIYPYNNSRGWLETGWTGAGSSCSVFVTRPSWVPKSTACPNQQGKKAGSMRPISDVSAVADPYTGVLVYESYPFSQAGFYVYGGTSVASPIIASVYALAGNSSSQHYGAKLYTASSSSLTDVLIGKNGIPGLANNAGQGCVPTAICAAMAGWDGPTGNGTPWGVGAF
ncbi:MAG TPA: S8 family serine peptidase [Candidatus Baltobacteraceae bacterium]|nr:S8 family serine peptidase [Candidatus Baltobacteraceae bacterium]